MGVPSQADSKAPTVVYIIAPANVALTYLHIATPDHAGFQDIILHLLQNTALNISWGRLDALWAAIYDINASELPAWKLFP